ncbi:MAG TPA: VOC family protein [Xanthomonadales bacterium]|nr:VOC family protein [Xanthomonadales bacterium]
MNRNYSHIGIMIGCLLLLNTPAAIASDTKENDTMQLGAFSISLAVQDIHASKAFYEKLGFTEAGGDIGQNWLILRNDQTTIGLFQGMFENNIMTFNPGWDAQAEELATFTDVREIQAKLKSSGVEFQSEAAPDSDGPASFVLADPDGNMILIDQHVNAPE